MKRFSAAIAAVAIFFALTACFTGCAVAPATLSTTQQVSFYVDELANDVTTAQVTIQNLRDSAAISPDSANQMLQLVSAAKGYLDPVQKALNGGNVQSIPDALDLAARGLSTMRGTMDLNQSQSAVVDAFIVGFTIAANNIRNNVLLQQKYGTQ